MKTKREIRRKRERRKEGKIKKWIRESERGREETEKKSNFWILRDMFLSWKSGYKYKTLLRLIFL